MRRLLDDEWDAVWAFSPDLLVHHPKSLAAPHMPERLDIPVILASPVPGFTPSAAFPSPLLPVATLGPLDRASHLLAMRGARSSSAGRWAHGVKTSSGWRAGARGPRRRRSTPTAAMSCRCPRTGMRGAFWCRATGSSTARRIGRRRTRSRRSSAGEPPFYVGFGSMPGLDPGRLTRIVVEALARASRRGLLATGGGALAPGDVPEHVHVVSAAPHDRPFRLVGAALHHGGGGTTGASLRAGLPTIVCPFFGDPPFRGRWVAALGVGLPPLDRRRLDVVTLTAAFGATEDAGMHDGARALAGGIAREDRVKVAAAFVERHGRTSGR